MQQEAVSEWISVSERLPINDEWLLLTNGKKHWLGKLDCHTNRDFYCKCCLEDFTDVTHWQTLPSLPEPIDD